MAMNMGCYIRQTARRFLAVTGGDLRSSTGLFGARQKARPCHTMPSSNNGLPLSDATGGMSFAIQAAACAGLGFALYWYSYNWRIAKLEGKCSTCNANVEVCESERKRMEE